ncbi:fimbrial biogenesis outer membrane usher protein, partial [Escherichia coli]|nr:fimbrial biogenesis outer membrane usher protein [Escherichia coli]
EESDIKYYFSFFSKTLVFYVPKQAIMNDNSDLAHKSQWDDGINALYLNYDAKLYHRSMQYDTKNNESYYASLDPGVNIGSWRVRNSGIWMKGYDGDSKYQNSYLYAERDLRELKSKLLLGESSTGSEIFDSIPFKGIRLSTSDDMIPYIERAFVPTVRGVANSVARIDVRQNGYLIYSTEVPSGPFALSDIPASEGSDLEVTVTEDNGAVQHFTVPFNSPAISIKSGSLRYDLTLGKYRPYYNTSREDNFGHFTVIYGFNELLTGYTGVQASSNYFSGAVGLGFNLYNLGAVSLDGVYSRNGYNADEAGSAVRIRYNKILSETNTSFNLASYQYASKNYSTFADSMERERRYSGVWKKKNDISISIRQSFNDYGNIDLSLNKTTYWDQKDESYANFSYSTSLFNRASLTVGWDRFLESYYNNEKEDVFSASISIPFGRWLNTSSTNLRYQIVSERDDSVSNSISLNGLTYDNRLSWGISQGINSKNSNKNRMALNTSLRNSFGTMSAMYNYSRQLTQYGGGLNGSIVLHDQGITFGQRINGAAALIDVDGAENVSVSYKPGIVTDSNGFAIVGGLSTYRKNDIYLEQSNIDSNTSIDKTISSVVPTDKAIVRATFATTKGNKAIFKLLNRDNSPVKFGAVVNVSKKESVSIVGDDGKVYVAGLDKNGILDVQWGKGSMDRCRAFYELNNKNALGLYSETLKCM